MEKRNNKEESSRASSLQFPPFSVSFILAFSRFLSVYNNSRAHTMTTHRHAFIFFTEQQNKQNSTTTIFACVRVCLYVSMDLWLVVG